LFPHATGRWAKKIRGKLSYFGPWDDPDGALQRYLDQRDDLYAGRTPRAKRGGLTVRDLCNRFLTAKRHLLDTRELTRRTWEDYFTVCERIVRVFGKGRLVDDLVASDFQRLRADFATTRGPVALCGDITRVRSVFRFAYEEGLIDRPVRYGQSFNRPSPKTLRKARNGSRPKLFTADEIKAMIDAAGVQLRSMLLLASNCALANSDLGNLPRAALDLEAGWLDYPRPKTRVPRRCPLWPETVSALQAALARRPKPKDKSLDDLVFITAKGLSWAKERADNPLSKEFAKLQKALGIHRKGRGFCSLRHVFQTIAHAALDPVATRAIMGHAADASDMAAVYREGVSDDRLRAVTDHVRAWLFAENT